MEMVLQTQVLKDVAVLQQKLYVPLAMATTHRAVEFRELPLGLLRFDLVDPKTPPFSKRYRLVVHHGGAWVSLPRPWLQDRNAADGDIVTLYQDGDHCYVRHQKPEPVCR